MLQCVYSQLLKTLFHVIDYKHTIANYETLFVGKTKQHIDRLYINTTTPRLVIHNTHTMCCYPVRTLQYVYVLCEYRGRRAAGVVRRAAGVVRRAAGVVRTAAGVVRTAHGNSCVSSYRHKQH